MLIFTESFLEQTAKDYDVSVEAVERISKLFPHAFYEKLEEMYGGAVDMWEEGNESWLCGESAYENKNKQSSFLV